MSDITFADACKAAIAGSSILPDDAIAGYAHKGAYAPIRLYCHRIAAFCVSEMIAKHRNQLPFDTDDTDLIDAMQECQLEVVPITRNWLANPTHKYVSYANVAFRRIIKSYLWTVAKGGTDFARGDGLTVEPLKDVATDGPSAYDDTAVDSGDGELDPYDVAPFGFRDPLDECIAIQEATIALQQLKRLPQGARLRLWHETGLTNADLS